MIPKWIYLIVIIIVSLAVIRIAINVLVDLEYQRKFDAFIVAFNKSYRNEEYYKRFEKFKEAVNIIDELNTATSSSLAQVYGITQFSDLSADEFQTKMLMKKRPHIQLYKAAKRLLFHSRKDRQAVGSGDEFDVPMSFNWEKQGFVTPVRNQGSCGACWAHSVIATIESMAAIAHNESVQDLSVQQMVDCAPNNNGCSGGDTCHLLQWLVQQDIPILPMQTYPTTNAQSVCEVEFVNRTQAKNDGITVKYFTCTRMINQEHGILRYLASVGPVTVGVNALNWQYYLGGIIQHHCDGTGSSINHAVQIVGYDRTGDTPYYIVRNSWGEAFGDRGYAKIEFGTNMCGIANQVSAIVVH